MTTRRIFAVIILGAILHTGYACISLLGSIFFAPSERRYVVNSSGMDIGVTIRRTTGYTNMSAHMLSGGIPHLDKKTRVPPLLAVWLTSNSVSVGQNRVAYLYSCGLLGPSFFGSISINPSNGLSSQSGLAVFQLGNTTQLFVPTKPTRYLLIDIIFFIALAGVVVKIGLRLRTYLRMRLGQCVACGYPASSVEDQKAGRRCSECGRST